MTEPGDSVAGSGRRPLCPRCGNPLARCLCASLGDVVENRVEVLLLQHPLEQSQAKGTAKLLAMSLRHCRLMVGEQFGPSELHAALHAPARDGTAACPVLLYPADAAAPAFDCGSWPAARLRLVVIDGTWRKSRKMLALNPGLRDLPRLALLDPPASRYALRRAEKAEQRSTLEATLLALEALEGDGRRYADVWTAMDRLMALLAAQRPAAATG